MADLLRQDMDAPANYAQAARSYCDQLGDPVGSPPAVLVGIAQVEASLAYAAAIDRLAGELARLVDALTTERATY